jgi:hypothetical protein
MECEFSTGDDGGKGSCVDLSLTVRGGNFEEAKKNMEVALQTVIASLLATAKLADLARRSVSVT